MPKCPNKNLQEWKDLEASVGSTKAYGLWDRYDGNVPVSLYNTGLNYVLKSVDILATDRGKQIFDKGQNNKWSLDKILAELQIPKEQKPLFKLIYDNLTIVINDKLIEPTLDEYVTALLAHNSFTIDITTIKQKQFSNENKGEVEIVPTSYYSNLTVPGGTNYTENEIATPDITPSAKGHGQFSTDKGIGWFRSDQTESRETDTDEEGNILYTATSLIRRILEIQSDLFQKNRKNENLLGGLNITNKGSAEHDMFGVREFSFTYMGNEYESIVDNQYYPEENQYEPSENYTKNGQKISYKEMNEAIKKQEKLTSDTTKNYFLQLLNKKGNWINFFIQAIVQDSIKKGFKTVLFPTGSTAANVEGHQTLSSEIAKVNKEIEEINAYLPLNEKERIDHLKNQLKKEKEIVKGNVPRINEIEKEIAKIHREAVFLYQEPMYHVEGFTYGRIQHTESPIRKGDHVKTLPENYKGYYAFGYNTERGAQSQTTIPISNEEAKKVWEEQGKEPNMDNRRIVEDLKKELRDLRGRKVSILENQIKNEPKNYKYKERKLRDLEAQKIVYEREGLDKLKPVEAFYTNRVTNILNKLYDVTEISDEYGNTWNEVNLSQEKASADIMLQTNDMNVSVASQETIERMKKAAIQMEVNLVTLADYAKDNPDIDTSTVNGVADLAAGVIAIAQDRENVAITEELIHIGSAIVEAKHPEIITKLISKINDFKIYNIVLQAYKGKKAYQLPNGKPDIRKIKKEAVDKLIAEVVVNNAEDIVTYPELSDLTTIGIIKEWWQNILRAIRGLYSISTIDIFAETGQAIVSGKVGVAGDITSSGVFSQEASNTSIPENTAVNDLQKRILDESAVLRLYEDEEIPGKKRHYSRTDPLTGKTVDIDFSVTEDIELRGKKKNFRDRTIIQKFEDDWKAWWGDAGHKYIERWIEVNLVDKETGYAREVFGEQEIATELEPVVATKIEQFAKDLIRSYPKGTKFLVEPMVSNRKNKNRTLASKIDFIALIPGKKDDKDNVRVEILDWKFTTINENATSEDIPWFKVTPWKAQMGEYTKIMYNYGMRRDQLQKARMVPFIMTYDDANPTRRGDGLVATKIEIGDVNSLNETNIYLIPVPIDSEPSGVGVIDKLVSGLNAYYKRTYRWAGHLTPEEQHAKEIRLNNLRIAIRRLHVTRDFEPLVGVGKNFIIAADILLEKFDSIDYATENPETVSKLLLELSALKMDSKRFEGINKVFLETYKDKEFTKEDNKILEDLGTISLQVERMVDRIKTYQNERLAYYGKMKGWTTEEEGDSMLNPSRQIKPLERSFVEGSALPNKRHEALANIVLNKKNQVELLFNKEMDKFRKVFKPLQALARTRGVSAFSLIGKIGKGGNIREDAEDTLQIFDKVDPAFMKKFSEAIASKDKTFISKNINMRAHNKYISEHMIRQEAEIRNAFHSADEGQNEMIKDIEVDKMRNLMDINSKRFIGWNTRYFVESIYNNIKSEDPKYQSKEYKEMANNQVALDAWNLISEWGKKAKDLGHIPSWKAAFFPLVEADSMTKFLNSKQGFSAELIDFFTDSITGRIDESKSFSSIDPETGEERVSIPVYFTRTDKNIEKMSQDISKVVPMWIHSILDYQGNQELEAELVNLVDVERNVGRFSVDKRNVIQTEAGKPVIITENNTNIASLEAAKRDAIYGQREEEGEIANLQISNIAKRLTRSDRQEDQISTEIRLKKILSSANQWIRHLGVGLSPAIAIANTAGQLFLSFIYKGTYYKYRDYARNTTKVLSNTENTKERALMNFLSAFSENNVILQRRQNNLKEGEFRTYLDTFSLSDIIQSTNSFPEKILQWINGLSTVNNTVVIDGKLINVRQYIKKQDRARKAEGISLEERAELNKSYEERVTKLKEESVLLIDAVVVTDEGIEIPGVSIEELAKFRVKIMDHARRLNGQMDENDKAAYRRSIIMNSFMMFKHWIPKLLLGRFHGIKQNKQSELWEYGRGRIMAKTLLHLGFSSLTKMNDLIHQTEEGMRIMDEMLEDKKIAHFERTGEVLSITKEEWYDLMHQELSRQMREFGLVIGVFALFLAARAAEPPENITASERNQFNYFIRSINKITDEILFFYNPISFEGMTSGSILPAINLVGRGIKILGELSDATQAIGDEEAMKDVHLRKAILNVVPIGYQIQKIIIPMVDSELAKDMGNAITKETNRR